MSYTINFEKATVDCNSSLGAEALRIFEEGKKPKTVLSKGGDGYTGELRHMVESILAGTPPSVVTPIDALNAVRICEAEEKSVRIGRAVKLG